VFLFNFLLIEVGLEMITGIRPLFTIETLELGTSLPSKP